MNVAAQAELKPVRPGLVPDEEALAREVLAHAAPRLFTAPEFQAMADAGVFDDDEEELELLEGVIVVMSRQGPAHAQAIRRLNRWLATPMGEAYALLPHLPVTLGRRNEPVPDLSVVPAQEGSKSAHPTRAQLVIEVSDTTLSKDRGLKLGLYARCGIPEYWIVNVKAGSVEVHRDPDPGAERYRTSITAGPDAVLTPVQVPGVQISVADLFA